MLPDFPKEKEKLQNFWNKYLAQKHKKLLGYFNTIPSFAIHEGDKWKITRTDGTESEQPFEELSGKFSISISDIPDLTPEKIMEKLDIVAADAARQMTQKIFEEIQQASDRVGKTTDARVQPLTKELLLETFERLEMDFDNNGNLIPPAIIMHPDAWKANEAKFREWDQDEEFATKQNEIINKKREEWHAREALRKLVD